MTVSSFKITCFGRAATLREVPDFVASQTPTRDLRPILGEDASEITYGEIVVTEPDTLIQLAQVLLPHGDISTLAFFAHEEEESVGVKLFGIDENNRAVLYIEGITRGQHLPGQPEPRPVFGVGEMVVLEDTPVLSGGRIERLVDEVQELFLDVINACTEDPCIDGAPSSYDLELADGIDYATYQAMVEKAIGVGLKAGSEGVNITIASGDEDNEAGICGEYPNGQITPVGYKLVDAVLAVCRPYGWSWEYNDGPVGRLSGYSKCADLLELEVEAVSALERAHLMTDLAAFLDAHLPAGYPDRSKLLGSTV